MASMSDYLEEADLNHTYNKVTLTPPTTWVGLHTTLAGDDDAGTEVTTAGGTNYTRIKVFDNGSGSPEWNLAVVDGVGYLIDNADIIQFPVAGANWGTVVGFGVYDAETPGTGNLLDHGAITSSKSIDTGEDFKFPIGDLNIRRE